MILVTGVARSGTSLVSGLLHQCGAWVGECFGATIDNPKGAFENVYLRENVVKQILASADADPLGVRAFPGEFPPIDGLREEVLAHVEGNWLFKDAKLLWMQDLWIDAFPEAKWVIVRRDPREIVRSCLQTGFMSQHSNDPEFWTEWVAQYLMKMEELEKKVDYVEVWPNRIASGNWAEIQNAAEFCGLKFDLEKCEEFFDARAWHEEDDTRPSYAKVILNTGKEEVRQNMEAAQKRGLPPVPAHFEHSEKAAIIGGGPSIKDQWREIRKFYMAGGMIFAMNGAHDYLIKRKVIPYAMVMMDARPENVEFLRNPHKDVKYFLASQCVPEAFDLLDGYQTHLWHVRGHGDDFIKDQSPIIGGGCTVSMKSLNIVRMMGFRNVHLFGVDSCLMDGEHHAYPQSLNDGEKTTAIRCGEKTFSCTGWMLRQAQDFQEFCMEFGRVMRIQVHGNGLLAAIIDEAKEVA